ncbi:hypothetical protein [Halobacteriovorax sp. JY17]|uniref:hypothetical protein n=1 Tax=Halobacteriovorax sp. JY17 TaxID=2014617 RepID=UPI000C64490C|nr:hypothetical protein [Halobacteriovorax sp. JY17]PIK15408.1 MAG: hypothetical protein CES88_01440 [Halobacteriovorax sp. JY17]
MSLEEKVLETLSFFNAMTLEQIYLDFDEDFLLEHKKYTYDDLMECLRNLEDQKKIKSSGVEKSKTWIRIYPKKSLLSKLLGFLK